jgi:hypothetical protein
MLKSFMSCFDTHFDVLDLRLQLRHEEAASQDHVRSQPPDLWGIVFVLTAYGLLITEATGAYVGIHFLRIARGTASKVVKT